MEAIYSIEKLKEQFDQEERLKYLFFWGHRQKNPNQIDKSCFSQWFESPFEMEGKLFLTAEHWMMAEKARLFGDDEIYAKILEVKHPDDAKKLGRKVRGFEAEVWEANRSQIVVKGNIEKFKSNEGFVAFLLGTGNRILVEASPVDRIWGIGMAKDHREVENPHAWKGLNLLGFALMEVRDLLIENA